MNLPLAAIRSYLATAFVTLIACGGGGGMEDAGPGDTMSPDAPAPIQCTVDPALVAERSDCLTDDHCPCGTYCDLGVCLAECGAESACGDGERCDSFGRCRGMEESALVPTPPAGDLGMDLRALDTSVRVDATTGEGVLHLTSQGAGGRARLLARQGAEIECPDGTFATECVYDAMPAGDTLVPVRFMGSPEGLGEVGVFSSGGNAAFVSIRRGDTPIDSAEFSGTYRGVAVLTASGLGDPADPGPAPVGPVRLPVTVEIYGTPSAGTVSIDNRRGAFGSAGAVVGTFSLAADGELQSGAAMFPVQPYLDADFGLGADYEVLSEIVTATMQLRDTPRTLRLELAQQFVGLGVNTRPAARWTLELARTGDVSGAAPSVGSDATLSADEATREATTLPWEERLDEVLRDSSLTPDFFDLWRTDAPVQWAHCFVSESPGTATDAKYAALGLNDSRFWITPALAAADGDASRYIHAETPFGNAIVQVAVMAGEDYLVPVTIGRDPIPGPARDLPCEGSVDYSVDIPLGSSTSVRNVAFDTCDELRARTGCTILDPTTERTYSVDGDVRLEGGGTRPPFVGTARWTRSCRIPETQPACAFTAACSEPRPSGSLASIGDMPASGLGTVSRDAECAVHPRSGALAADVLTDTETIGVRALIDECLSDFAILRGAPPSVVGSGYQHLLGNGSSGAALDVGRCVDPGRFLVAIQHGLRTLRNDDDPTPEVAQAGAFALRRIGRFLELHGMIASEATSQAEMAAVFSDDPTMVEAGVRLDQSIAGWDLLFHPRVAGSFGQLLGGGLQTQDYRVPVLGVSPRRGDPQQNSLPAAILDTVTSQLDLQQAVLEEAALELEPDAALDQFATVMPRVLLASALAYGLYDRAAGAADGALGWETNFRASEARAITALSKSQDVAYRLESGGNPLGIEDVDLPLYFLADGSATDGSFGPGGRYAAVSDFLLGTGPDSTAWAPSLVRQAESSLDAARAGFLGEVDRTFRADVATAEHERWLDEVREQFNVRLFNYCGSSTTGSPIDDPNFRSENCAVDAINPRCAGEPEDWWTRWTEADVLGRICVATFTNNTFNVVGLTDRAARSFAERCVRDIGTSSDTTDGWDVVRIAACDTGNCLFCVGDDSIEPLPLEPDTLDLQPSRDPRPTQVATRIGDVVPPAVRSAAVETCRAIYPSMREHVPYPSSPLEIPACVTGSIGEAYLDVVSSERALQTARAAHAEFIKSYNIAMDSCTTQRLAGTEATRLRSDHQANMGRLFRGRAAADSAAAVAGAAKECLAASAAGVKDTPWGTGTGAALAIASCVAGGVQAAAQVASASLTGEIDGAQLNHENQMAALAEASDLWICYNDALSELVGMHRAALDIEQAAFDLQSAFANIDGLHADAQRAWLTGHHYLMALDGSAARPTGSDVWIDENVSSFVREMRLARRTTYLALRAVEYEQQQSLAERTDIYEAATPADLRAVLLSLWTSAATRTVGGSRPSDLSAVLSLRDDVLRLRDESGQPAESHPLTPIERFRLALANPNHAVYDEAGNWEGQRIPFELIPLGAFGFDAGAVPIYAATDCAERIWSVNASILGEDVINGSDTSFVRVDLLKRNTFFSQWCGSAPEGQPYQVASTRPTRNLFREPGEGELVGGELGTEFDVSSETRARIQAFVNVDRGTLETPDYANGESSELAARGLYGQYALFIPAAIIARESAGGVYDEGLVLDRIDDILIRLDYVSVAR